jgi:hypothetical protein
MVTLPRFSVPFPIVLLPYLYGYVYAYACRLRDY